MSLIRWRSRTQLPTVFDEMDKLLGSMLRSRWPLEREEIDFGPAVDVYEKDDEIVVEAELPGAKREDIQVNAENDRVTIRGETKQEEEVKEEGYYRKEIRRGSFYRTVPLPAPIDETKVTAKFTDGVLTVNAPKAPDVRGGKKVEIE